MIKYKNRPKQEDISNVLNIQLCYPTGSILITNLGVATHTALYLMQRLSNLALAPSPFVTPLVDYCLR